MRFVNCELSRETGALQKSVKPVKLKQHIKFLRQMEIPRNNARGMLSNTEIYELKGVIVHIGVSTSSGHYVAYVKNNEQWTEWSDTKGKIST